MDKKTIIVIFTGRVLQVGIALISLRIFTTLLSAEEVGNLYLINSIFAFFGLVLINPVGMYINRKLHQWSDEKSMLNWFFLFNIYLVFLSVVSVFIVYALNKGAGVGASIDLKLLIVFIMLNIYFNTWNSVIIPSLNMLNHRISCVVFTVATLVLGLTLSVFLVKIFSNSAVMWLSGALLAQVITTIFALIYFIKVTKNKLDFKKVARIITKENLGAIAVFALPLGITTFFMWLQNSSYRMIMENTVGLQFLGFIGIGIGIASNITVVVESIMNQFLHPNFYNGINTCDAKQRNEAWNNLAQITLPVYISLALFVTCLSPYLINILASSKFSEAWVYVAAGAWIEFLRVTTNTLSSVAHSEMQTKYLVKSYFIGGFLTVLGVYLGAKHQYYQIIIPAVLVFSGFVTMSVMYFDMRKLMHINIGMRRIKQSIMLSLPFALALVLYNQPRKLLLSIVITAFFGLYFILVQYKISGHIFERKKQ